MGWVVRGKGDTGLPEGSLCPDYGLDSDKFTIQFWHSGKFMDFGRIVYCGPHMAISYVDYVDIDQISIIEVFEMVKELGLQKVKCIHCSKGGAKDCHSLYALETDNDAVNMVQYIDGDGMLGIYVEHEDEIGEAVELEATLGENVKGGGEDARERERLPPTLGENVEGVEDDATILQFPEPLYSVVDGDTSEDSDDTQSIGSDSDFSEGFVDSDDEECEDDVLFEKNIDDEVEWVGMGQEEDAGEGCSKEQEKGNKSRQTYPISSRKLNIAQAKFHLDMRFPNSDSFKDAVRAHSIKLGRDVRFTFSEKWKVQAKCRHSTCPWVIYASRGKNEDTFQVKTFNGEHKCPRLQKVSHANAKWLANMYKDMIHTNPKWPVQSMMVIAQKQVKLTFDAWQMYRAKKIATEMGRGAEAEQYSMIWSYAEEMKRADPHTSIRIKCKQVGGKPQFKRMYICWGPLKKGFLESCRPLIFLDGCHLKTPCGGILLTAIGMDPNNDMYPFAYAVVEKEKKKSWSWFLKHLVEDLHIVNPYSWTIMSDKQKGLIDAVEQVLGGCEHRFCVQHLYQNFKLTHRGLSLKNNLWKAARASRIVDFDKAMREMKEKDVDACAWLVKRPAANWSRSHFSTFPKSDVLVNNMSESFNSMVLKARSLPIVSMFEAIRLILMKRIHVRRDKMLKQSGNLCPKISSLLELWKKKSMDYIAHWNGKDQFEIENIGVSKFKVHLGERSCSCRRWELTGIPCPHAISAMNYLDYEPEDYVHDYYKKDTFIKAYSHLLPTLNSPDMWPQLGIEPLIPPIAERMPGRPKNHDRNKDKVVNKDKTKLSKKGITMTCSLCHKTDHNMRRCGLNKKKGLDVPAPDVDVEGDPKMAAPAKKRGRKRKNVDPTHGLELNDAASPSKRGRKRKNVDPTHGLELNDAASPSKRGRKRKNVDPTPTSGFERNEVTSPPKRGRKRQNVDPTGGLERNEAASPSKRGRKRKNVDTTSGLSDTIKSSQSTILTSSPTRVTRNMARNASLGNSPQKSAASEKGKSMGAKKTPQKEKVGFSKKSLEELGTQQSTNNALCTITDKSNVHFSTSKGRSSSTSIAPDASESTILGSFWCVLPSGDM